MTELAETYLFSQLDFRGHHFEIYIYENQADVLRDDVAYVCERWDYDSAQDLIRDFIARVSGALLEDKFQGNRRSASRRDFALIALFLAIVVGITILAFRWFFRH